MVNNRSLICRCEVVSEEALGGSYGKFFLEYMVWKILCVQFAYVFFGAFSERCLEDESE